jgi:hypothetical protein
LKILLFLPEAGLLEYSVPAHQLALGYGQLGHDVYSVSCETEFINHCAVMASRKLNPASSGFAKATVCRGCTRINQLLESSKDKADVHSIKASHLISNDFETALDKFIENLSHTNWRTAEFLGVPIALFASYEFIITKKLEDTNFASADWDDFMRYVRPVGLTAVVAHSIKRDIDPDAIIVYDSLYGSNRVWVHLAREMGWNVYSIRNGYSEAGASMPLQMYHDDNKQILLTRSEECISRMQSPISFQSVLAGSRQQVAKLSAIDVMEYSAPYNGRQPNETRLLFGLNSTIPVLLVLLSSNDERFAAKTLEIESVNRQPTVFTDQLDWLNYLCEIALRRQDLQFIVRIHPRMFKNDRDAVPAKGATTILELLERSPANVIVNTPEMRVSLVDLFQITDGCLVGTSSTGLQAASLGLPVVIHNPELAFSYPTELGLVVEDRSDYEETIDAALEFGWSIEQMRLAYRFIHFMNTIVTRDLLPPVPLKQNPLNNAARAGILKSSLARNLPFLLKQQWRNHADRKLLDTNLKTLAKYPKSQNTIPFESVLLNNLDGLHQVESTQIVQSHANETEGLRAAAVEILEALGSFPSDKTCLSTKIERFILDF